MALTKDVISSSWIYRMGQLHTLNLRYLCPPNNHPPSRNTPTCSPILMQSRLEHPDLLSSDLTQEDLVYATLTSQLERLGPIQQQRAALVAQADACSELPEVLEELLTAISACLNTYQIVVCVHMLAVYGSILRADQFAAYFLSAWPFMPSLSGLRQALQTIKEQRQAEQEVQQQAEEQAQQLAQRQAAAAVPNAKQAK